MKKDFISQVDTKTPLQRHYDMTGQLPVSNNYDLDANTDVWRFNFNSMRMVCDDLMFDKLMSLFGKQIKRSYA